MQRLEGLATGHKLWMEDRKAKRPFPGGPYVLLHTLSHLLIQSLAMRCGYPASSIRERIYADTQAERFGILLYTGSPDAEGTLGGLVQEARHIEDHLSLALADGSAVLQRSDLRPARARHEHGEALAPRGGLPWLRAGRRDLVRDAQRLPRSRPRRAGARRPETPPSSGAIRMIEALLDLPAHLRKRLAGASASGIARQRPTLPPR